MKNDIFVQEMIFGREDELSTEQRPSKLGAVGFEYRQLIRLRRELRDLRLIHLAISTTNHSISQDKMIRPNTLARNIGKHLRETRIVQFV